MGGKERDKGQRDESETRKSQQREEMEERGIKREVGKEREFWNSHTWVGFWIQYQTCVDTKKLMHV